MWVLVKSGFGLKIGPLLLKKRKLRQFCFYVKIWALLKLFGSNFIRGAFNRQNMEAFYLVELRCIKF